MKRCVPSNNALLGNTMCTTNELLILNTESLFPYKMESVLSCNDGIYIVKFDSNVIKVGEVLRKVESTVLAANIVVCAK
jgi:hypothetical protein